MSDPENFLTRWSRRKRKAEESVPPAGDEREESKAEVRSDERAADAVPAQSQQATKIETAEPEFDLSTLPPIETITAETDIRAFLAPGVPADVKLAALRRAWAADPKVRDFVGLNDYDFDFHTPGAIHGFGPLEMTDELRREVVRIVSAWQPQPEAPEAQKRAEAESAARAGALSTQPAAAIEEKNAEPTTTADASDQPAQAQDELISPEATTQRNKESIAPQQEHSPPENLQTLARRGHGRALPK